MKLKSIKIEGMHNVVNKTYDLSDLTYLYGQNGVGKSTVMQAIQLALLGYIPGTAKTKAELFRHANSHTMAVTLDIDDGGSCVIIRRVWTGTASSINAIVDIRPEGYDISSIIGNLELPIFNFGEFLDMTANKLKDWFINFLPSANTTIDWYSVLRENVSDAGLTTIDDEFINGCVSDIKSYRLTGVDEIRKANDYFKEMLSFRKKEADRVQSTIQSLVCYDDVDTTTDETEIRSEILKCQNRQNELQKMQHNHELYMSKVSQLSAFSDCTAKSPEEDENYIAAEKEIKRNTDSSNALQTQIDKTLSKCDSIVAEQTKLLEEIYSITSDTNMMEKVISGNGICPITSTECSSIKELISEYKKKIEENNKKVDEIDAKRSKLQDDLMSAKQNVQKLQYNQSTFTSKIGSARLIKDNIVRMYGSYAKLKDQIGDEPVVEEDDTDYPAIISELQNTLVKIEANKRYSSLIDTLTAEKFKTDAEIICLNSWIKLTGVNGLQNDDSATKPFIDLAGNMDKYIQAVFGGSVRSKFNLEAKANSFSFGIERKGAYIPFNLLSSGEKCMYTLALMISLVDASNSQLKLVMVDDLLDHLDNINVDKLFKSLQTVSGIQMVFAGVKDVNGDFVIEVKG